MRELKVPSSPPPADAAERRAAKPVVVYRLDAARLNDAPLSDDARSGMGKIGETIVPAREGRAFDVPAGHFFRIVSIEGPQVGDLNLWNAPSSRALLQRQDARAPRDACEYGRPPLELAPISQADGDDYA